MQNDAKDISSLTEESTSKQTIDITEEKGNEQDFSSSNISNKKVKKKPIFCQHIKWVKEEDDKLRQLVEIYGENNWKIISSIMENRTTRQCRERWHNYLNPNLKIGNWTQEEDELIMEKRKEIGPKWKEIEKFFENRTDAMIKTRYNALIREQTKKSKKTIIDLFLENNKRKTKKSQKIKKSNDYWEFLDQNNEKNDYLFEYDDEFFNEKFYLL